MSNTMKQFIHYVSLNVFGMIGISCYILADTFFVAGSLGADGLAALNFALPLYCVINGTGLMIGIGGATRYTILKAENAGGKANEVFSHALLLGIGLGLFFALIGLLFTEKLALLLGASGEIGHMTSIYLKTILCFSPFFVTNNVLLAFIRNDGNPGLAMAGMLLGSFCNVVLDYVFIFPLGMGMFGAAFATGLAPIISILLLSRHFISHQNKFTFVRCKMRLTEWKELLALGGSSFVTEVSSGVVLIVFNLVILQLAGNVGVAAYGVVANLALVVIAIFTGIAQGIQPLVSSGYGSRDTPLIRQVLRWALMLSVGTAAAVYLLCISFSGGIVSAFNQQGNEALTQLAVGGIRLYFIGFLFAGVNIITAAFLSGTNHPKSAFTVSIVRGCIGMIPIVFLMAAQFGMNGAWLAFPVTEGVTFAISLLYLKKFQ